MIKNNNFTVAKAALMVLVLNSLAAASTFTFTTDPLEGTTVRNTAGRQVVGGELFVSFFTATDVYTFDETAFGMGSQVHFANGSSNSIPSNGVNVVVLEDLDNDANPLTPFGAGNAADLLAARITSSGPGVFIYFNSSLDLPRLVYSDDLSSSSADLRILARMLNLDGPQGIAALSTFTASNFAITGSQAAPEPSGVALAAVGLGLLALRGVRRLASRRGPAIVAILFAAVAAHAADADFTHVIDNTGGLTSFGIMPAISNSGAVAFNANGVGYETGAVFRWQSGHLTVIASKKPAGLVAFGESLIVNSAGVVGFGGRRFADNDSIIATGDGGPVKVIASASRDGLVGGAFLGIGGMNEPGDVVFLALRKFFPSQAIFQGNGGPLTPVVDTATNPLFTRLGNAAINASGGVVFGGFTDTSEGIFTNWRGAVTTVVTTDAGFNAFLDPVINNSLTVATAGFPNAGGPEVFTARANKFDVVTNPASSLFSLVDNVTMNNSGDVAFFANESNGRDGIFIKRKQDSNPVPLIETGAALFGSLVTRLSMGRYSLNDHDQVVFLYGLSDGRSGMAIATPRPGRER